jgi:hypothetical protein
LVNKINTIIGGLPLFKQYFLHVGFPDNWNTIINIYIYEMKHITFSISSQHHTWLEPRRRFESSIT